MHCEWPFDQVFPNPSITLDQRVLYPGPSRTVRRPSPHSFIPSSALRHSITPMTPEEVKNHLSLYLGLGE